MATEMLHDYSYQARMKRLRDLKIKHTYEKKEQKGYMDGDDYATVPLPAGYKFNPIYNEGEHFFYGLEGNSINFKAFLENHPLYIDKDEILAGRWADMLPGYRRGCAYDKYFPYHHLKELQSYYKIGTGIGADAHFACDYTIGLELGFGGLLNKIRHYAALHGENKKAFYDAEEMVVLAIQDFIRRHIVLAEEMLDAETDERIRENLSEMIAANKKIISDKPESLLEACQWLAWFNTVSRMYDRDGAGCMLDVILYPYYKADIESGVLDEEKAVFILANFLLNETHYHQLSGKDENGNDLTNELSFLILDAGHMLNCSLNLTVNVHDCLDEKFLKKAIYYLFTDRNGWPRFSGERGLMEFTKNEGVTKEDAYKRIAIGCNWVAIPGLEYPINDCVKINTARVFEIAFAQMKNEPKPSVERLFELFIEHLTIAVDVTGQGINHHLDHQHKVLPELVMNLLMQDTIEKGEDISVCAKYLTMGVDGVALGTVADSFAALEQRIEKEKILSWEEAFDAIENNYEGTQRERIRLMLKSSERYCQGNSLGDKWAQRVSQHFAQTVKAFEMPGRRQLVPGWFSWSSTIAFGKVVGATPDGRLAHTPVTHGANPNPGFRKDGAATAMSTGVALARAGYGNTCPWQLEMDPKISAQEGGLENVEHMLRTHFDLGGTLVNINILDRDVLMRAHENPELYPDLVVRVTGFTAYFAVLSPTFRQLMVDRFVEGF